MADRYAFGGGSDAKAKIQDAMRDARAGSPEHALLLAMDAALDSLGECRLETPYGRLHAVLTESGLRFCCDHKKSHCSAVLAGRG